MNKDIVTALAWAAAIIVVSLAASWLRRNGYIDHDTMLRVVAMNGLMVAYYGNRIPKMVAPSACARQIARFSGWTFVLSGLTYAALWAFAPLPVAMTFGTGAVAVGVILSVGYCFWLRSQSREGTVKH